MVPKKDLIYLEVSFEQASKFIVSAGTTNIIKFLLHLLFQLYQIILTKNYFYFDQCFQNSKNVFQLIQTILYESSGSANLKLLSSTLLISG